MHALDVLKSFNKTTTIIAATIYNYAPGRAPGALMGTFNISKHSHLYGRDNWDTER